MLLIFVTVRHGKHDSCSLLEVRLVLCGLVQVIEFYREMYLSVLQLLTT